MNEEIEMLLRARDYIYMVINSKDITLSQEDTYKLCHAQTLIEEVLPNIK